MTAAAMVAVVAVVAVLAGGGGGDGGGWIGRVDKLLPASQCISATVYHRYISGR